MGRGTWGCAQEGPGWSLQVSFPNRVTQAGLVSQQRHVTAPPTQGARWTPPPTLGPGILLEVGQAQGRELTLLTPSCPYSPDGYLYEREAILEYILHQKKEIARQMKAYEKQRGARREEQKALQLAAAQDQVRGFLEKEAAIVSRPLNPFTPKAIPGDSPDDARPGSSAGPTGKDKDKALPSFWIPSLTPEAKATKLEKPSRTVTCPMSGKPLRMSDLTPVRFTPLDSSVDRVGLITRSERYVCAVTRDSLSNATPCAVLRPSGAVVTLECVEKLIRKDMVDPVNGEKLTDRDIIVLQRGGTGFAGSGVKLQAEKSRPVMQA
uniref:Nitric oxide synthase-interacting protein n=1 Tax=Suricata suricatta TaxID=37032 RepID=A0A673UV64_SURSU